MESKLKAQAMDQAGEVYENLLLRESGYPHLPEPVFIPEKKPSECKECKGKGWVFVGFGEDHECESCFDKSPESENIVKQSYSEEWNDAVTNPNNPCLCETKNKYIGIQFQYWNGDFFGLTCDDKTSAITFMTVESEFQNPIQWREVQP